MIIGNRLKPTPLPKVRHIQAAVHLFFAATPQMIPIMTEEAPTVLAAQAVGVVVLLKGQKKLEYIDSLIIKSKNDELDHTF